MSGGQPLNYGTQGVPSTTNYPGARNGGVMWCDSIGDLWLMGGIGNDEVPIGPGKCLTFKLIIELTLPHRYLERYLAIQTFNE